MSRQARWMALTAFPPITWGSSYWVTAHFLPADIPLWGAVMRALPAGMILLLVRHRLPRGRWWWRSLVLGLLNVGIFFSLVYLAAQLLPSSIASTIMATSPATMMLLAAALTHERLRAAPMIGAAVGLVGVALALLTGPSGAINPLGVLAAATAMVMSSVGFILAKRWADGTHVLSITSWQLVAGGLVLVPVAVVVEGPPPALGGSQLAAFAYLSLVSTALAYVAWFSGLLHLPAGTVGLIGLLNPVTGVLLGVLVAHEHLSLVQLGGIALVLVGILLGRPRSGSPPPQSAEPELSAPGRERVPATCSPCAGLRRAAGGV